MSFTCHWIYSGFHRNNGAVVLFTVHCWLCVRLLTFSVLERFHTRAVWSTVNKLWFVSSDTFWVVWKFFWTLMWTKQANAGPLEIGVWVHLSKPCYGSLVVWKQSGPGYQPKVGSGTKHSARWVRGDKTKLHTCGKPRGWCRAKVVSFKAVLITVGCRVSLQQTAPKHFYRYNSWVKLQMAVRGGQSEGKKQARLNKN